MSLLVSGFQCQVNLSCDVNNTLTHDERKGNFGEEKLDSFRSRWRVFSLVRFHVMAACSLNSKEYEFFIF